MPQQLSLPDPAELSSVTGRTHTSALAAALVLPKTGTQRMRVLTAVTQAPHGLTDAQIQWVTGLSESTERPRRVELVQQGWVTDSGRRRLYRGHAEAIVWVLTDEAVRTMEQVA